MQRLNHVWLLAAPFEPRGSSYYTYRLARALPTLGVRATVLVPPGGKPPGRWTAGLDIQEIPFLNAPLLSTVLSRWFIATDQLLAPSLIHAERPMLDVLAYQLAFRHQCPYVLTIHNPLPAGTPLRVDPDYFGGMIAVSPSVERDLILEAQVPASWVTTILSGVEVPELPTLPPKRPADRVPVVGTIGALEQSRGTIYFLMAAEIVLSSGYDVEFIIAGVGPEEDTLRRAAQKLDLSNRVTFIDYLPEYTQLVKQLDVYVHPVIEEGIGTQMLQAMAFAKPVVATKINAIDGLFRDGEQLLLVPPANHVTLAERIRQLLDNPDRARRLAVAGQESVRERFTVDRMARETVGFYQRVIQEHEELAKFYSRTGGAG